MSDERLPGSEQSVGMTVAIYEEALQEIVDKHDGEDAARLIASKALGDAAEYLNTGRVAWHPPRCVRSRL